MDGERTPPACSSAGSNSPTSELQCTPSGTNDLSIVTSGMDGLSFGSGGVDEPTTPPPSLSEQGPKLRSATKSSSFQPRVCHPTESDESEDCIAEDASAFTPLGISIVPDIRNGKIHHRYKDIDQPLILFNKETVEAKVRQLKKDKGVKDDNDIVKSLEKYKKKYLRTKRAYNSLDDLKDIKGYEDLWQVRKMKAEEVCDKIEKIFEKRFSDGVGNCFELENEQKTVYVEELHCYVLKGKSTYRCDYDNKQTMEVFTRIDLLLRLIYILLKTDMTVNIRSIPYSYKEMFANTTAVQKVLERICKAIGCDRDSLNIFASVKGSIVGHIEFKFTKGETIYTTNCQKAIGIEPRDVAMELEFVKLTKKELLLILVVEKDTIFQRLVEEKFHHRFRCIIITGCGVPTVATRTLLHKAQKKLNLPVVFLGDQNGGGFKICSNYYCGSQDMAYDSINLCTPNIELLGLSPSDLEEHGIPAGSEPVRGLETIKELNFVKGNPEVAKQVAKMKLKVDVEVMSRIYLKYLTQVYLPLKFQEMVSD